MKLATFLADGRERTGIVVDEGIVELTDLVPDMIALITDWPSLKGQIGRRAAEEKAHYTLKDVRLLAPVPRPQKVMAIGLNYADHIAESGAQTPEKQIWFAKLGNAVNGPYSFDPNSQGIEDDRLGSRDGVRHRQALPPRNQGQGA